MSAYKQFTTNDILVNTFEANKLISLQGGDIITSSNGINFYIGQNNPLPDYILETTGNTNLQTKTGIYNNIKHLYYSNYLSSSYGDEDFDQIYYPGADTDGDKLISFGRGPRFENYLQTNISYPRYFPTESLSNISVISIPAKLIGSNIVPSTFSFTSTRFTTDFETINIVDDGEGNLLNGEDIIGNIFYHHGIYTFTTGGLENWFDSYFLNETSISYSSSFTIYESQFKCTVSENDFNISLNPSLLSGSTDDTYYDYATSSIFTPYVTTIGLYNDNKELLMVAKLSHPIPISKTTDTTFIISYDM
jgi:hypothetical protein